MNKLQIAARHIQLGFKLAAASNVSQRASVIEEITTNLEMLHTLDQEKAAKLSRDFAKQVDQSSNGIFSQTESDDSLWVSTRSDVPKMDSDVAKIMRCYDRLRMMAKS